MSEHAAPFVASRQSPDHGRGLPEWRPFPVDALPAPLRDLAVQGGKSIGCDPAFVALPSLSVVGAAIGNSRTIELKEGWREPAVVWTAAVGESGDGKSPALDLAFAPLREREAASQREYVEALKDYKVARQRYEADLAAWKHGGASGSPPEEPPPPEPKRYIVGDVTVEALASRMAANPRGLLLGRDELAGWFKSFDAYRGGRGGDSAFWLSAHSARSHSVDRKGDPPIIYLERAAVWIAGGIQPRTLEACIRVEHFENGLIARVALAMPPRHVAKWTNATVPFSVRSAYDDAVGDLLALEMATSGDGAPEPVPLFLSDDARNVWIEFFNDFAERRADTVGDESAALAKLLGYAARFALIHQLARDPAARTVDAEAMRAGVRLAKWFADEEVRVYAILREPPEATDRRRLVEWIARAPRNGRVTERDVARGLRTYRGKHAAEDALAELVAVGAGHWEDREPGEDGGRPTREFVLDRSEPPPDDGDAATVTKPRPDAPADPGSGDGTEAPKAATAGSVTVASVADSGERPSVADTGGLR